MYSPTAEAIAVDPGRSGTIYRGIFLGPVLKSTDGGRTWFAASPIFFSSHSVIVDRAQLDTVYAVVAGGLYRSTDGGANWSRLSSSLPAFGSRLQVAGRDGPGTLFAVGGGGTVFGSKDGGATWTSSPVAGATIVYQLAAEPSPGGSLFAATDRGVFRSDDLGLSWTGGDFFSGYPVHSVAAGEPSLVYAGTFKGGNGFFRSEDGGARWTESNEGLHDGAVVSIAVDPRMNSRIYAGGLGIFRSDDFGRTWQRLERNLRPTLVAADPSSPDRLYAISDGQLWRSGDSGTSWTPSPGLPPNLRSLVVDAAGILYATDYQQVLKSIDAGDHWLPISRLPAGQPVFPLAADPSKPSLLYGVASPDSGFSFQLFRTDDAGESWRGPLRSVGILQGIGPVAASSTIPSILYAALSFRERFIFSAWIEASFDGGTTWRTIFGTDIISSIAVDPVRPATLYVGTPSGVFVTGPTRRTTLLGGPSQPVVAVSAGGSALYTTDYGSKELSVLRLDASTKREPRAVSSR